MSGIKRKLTITACRPVHRGQGANGPYTIYEVEAKTAQGGPVKVPLRSFDRLDPGLTWDFLVEPYEANGMTSYTLKGGPKPDPELLEARVAWLEEQVRGLLALAGKEAA